MTENQQLPSVDPSLSTDPFDLSQFQHEGTDQQPAEPVRQNETLPGEDGAVAVEEKSCQNVPRSFAGQDLPRHDGSEPIFERIEFWHGKTKWSVWLMEGNSKRRRGKKGYVKDFPDFEIRVNRSSGPLMDSAVLSVGSEEASFRLGRENDAGEDEELRATFRLVKDQPDTVVERTTRLRGAQQV